MLMRQCIKGPRFMMSRVIWSRFKVSEEHFLWLHDRKTSTILRVVQMQTKFYYSHRTHTWIQSFAIPHSIRIHVADFSFTTSVSCIFKPTFRTSFLVYVLRIEKKKNYSKPNHLYISHPYIKITSQYIVTHMPVAGQRLGIHDPENIHQ
jgi:hypothetical protein